MQSILHNMEIVFIMYNFSMTQFYVQILYIFRISLY